MKKTLILIAFFTTILACNQDAKPAKETNKEVKTSSQKAFPQAEEDSVLREINLKIRKDINNPNLYVERARWYMKKGDKREAIINIDQAVRLDSTNLETLLVQAELFFKGGRLDASKRILDKTLILYPNSSDAYLLMSELFLIGQDNKQSIKYADLAIKNDIYNEKAYYVKGFNFLELGDTNKAISSIQTSVEQNPDYYDGYLQLGLIYSEMGNPLAVDYFNNALKVKPNDKNALYAKGMFEQENDMLNEAMQTYTKAMKAHPDFREAFYNMGYLHMYYLKLYREGLKYFTDAIEVDPEYYQAYYNRGYSFELLGDINNAAKDYRKALSIAPDYDLAAEGLNRVTEK